ncbi:uncharacterized protein LOC105443479 [Strongylocentrotus purpuratus]|uniref:Uncharacterized protein n=1 Tax=Strongylocentrotus purpuratus TaxID=7668 RepID=A0A7M7PNV0_STRPU|nr:uncharacterized protein LOC105443479 [Strongylocentrotus purpuratus]
MMLMTSKELIPQLQTLLAFSLMMDVIKTSYGMPQSPVWRNILLKDSYHQQASFPQSGAANWLDSTAELVWLFGGQATLNNKTSTLDHLWRLDLQTMNWTQIQHNKENGLQGDIVQFCALRGNSLLLLEEFSRQAL